MLPWLKFVKICSHISDPNSEHLDFALKHLTHLKFIFASALRKGVIPLSLCEEPLVPEEPAMCYTIPCNDGQVSVWAYL